MNRFTLLIVFYALGWTACCSSPRSGFHMPELTPTFKTASQDSVGSAVALKQDGPTLFLLSTGHQDGARLAGNWQILETIRHPELDVSIIVVVGIVDPDHIARLNFEPVPPGQLLIALGWQLGNRPVPMLGLSGDPGVCSCRTIGGMSGGAIYNMRGELVGIISSSTRLQVGPMDSIALPISHYVPISLLEDWIRDTLK